MKKLSLIVFLILGMSVVAIASDGYEKLKKQINIREHLQGNKTYRDVFVSVSAWYDAEADVVELECYDIKNADVYIVNTYGDIVSSGSFDSTFNSYYVLDVPEQAGIYWLIIDSPVLYGEGIFEVK